MNNVKFSTVIILLDDMSKIREFNNKVKIYPNRHLDLISGRYRVDAKSLMGIFSLDLSKPITLEYEEEYEDKIKELFSCFLI